MQNKFDNFGLMVDCSRNAVMSVDSLKHLIDLMEKMGYNSLQLYTEETYEVEGEPYFGYQRGRYKISEIQEVDKYAKAHNVKLIPCIQTLAHLKCIFRWDTYWKVNDIEDILMIGEERTYQLIDNMFASLRKAYSSDIIHIGMDEAWQVGRGAYYTNHGDYNRYQILLEHLKKVTEIAAKYGFRCMLWSDMFIREAKCTENFDFDSAKKDLNKLADLVYWNYYTTNKADYDNDIDFHHRLCDNTWFAGGFWCWSGFAPFNNYSIKSSRAAIESCLEKGVKNAFFTLWGDNGFECSIYSMIPAMFNISCYVKGIKDENQIKELFFKEFNIKYDDFMLLDLPNEIRQSEKRVNPCKYMLYNDPFLGLHDKVVKGDETNLYKTYSQKIHEASKNAGEYKYLFDYLGSLCDVLEVKYDLGFKTRKAYKENDKKELSNLASSYDEAIVRIKKFYELFRVVWEKENKTYGFEVQDARIGGLLLRLENCKRRLEMFVEGKVKEIPELEEVILPVRTYEYEEDEEYNFNNYQESTSACPM